MLKSVLRKIVLLILLVLPGQGFADNQQDFLNAHARFFRVFHSRSNDIQFSALYNPDVKEDGGVGAYDLERYSLDSELPLAISRDSYFRYGLDYSYSTYTFQNRPAARLNNDKENLHKISLNLGFGTFLTDRVLVTGVYQPGIYSDLDDGLTERDTRQYGDVTLVTEVNPGAQLFFGIRRDDLFEEHEIYPILGVKLLGQDGRVYVDLSFPTHAAVRYNFNRIGQVYAGVWTEGYEYASTNNLNEQAVDIGIREQRLGVGTKLWPTSWLSVGLEAGAMIESEFEFKRRLPGQFRGDLKDSWYVGAYIGFAPS